MTTFHEYGLPVGPQAQIKDEAMHPSPLFLEVIQNVGARIGLDPQQIAGGAPIEFKGVTFWLAHHGAMDPEGLVLSINMGEITAEFEAAMFRQMLEHNAMTPAAVGGYYSLLPGTGTAMFCVRMNLARASNAADAVLAYVGLFAHQVDEFTGLMERGLEQARRQMGEDSVAGGA